jgi:transposase InsO family protein
MSGHPNAPLTPEGRQRLCERIDAGRPLAHVADEGGVSRTALTKWYKRWLAHGEAGLLDRTSRPERQPTRTPDDIEEMVIQLRVAEKWGPDRIAGHLATVGDGSVAIAPATVQPDDEGRVALRPYASDEERTAALADFLNTYNHERPHSALGNKPPASRVPITTYRLAPRSGNFATPRIEGLGYEPTLFDLL